MADSIEHQQMQGNMYISQTKHPHLSVPHQQQQPRVGGHMLNLLRRSTYGCQGVALVRAPTWSIVLLYGHLTSGSLATSLKMYRSRLQDVVSL